MPPAIDPEKCIECGLCVEICSEDVFLDSVIGEVPEITYADECWHCGACVLDCPTGAISLYIPLPMRVYKEGSVS